MKKARFAVAVIFAGILWGVIGLFTRAINAAGFSSIQVAFVRAFFASVLMLIGLALLRRELLKIRLRDLWCFLGTGICSLTFFNCCYFYTINATSLSVASILLYTAPVFVALLSSLLFHERMTAAHAIALLLALAGCVLVTGVLLEKPVLTPVGILAGFGAGFGYALYSIFSHYALKRGYHSMTITFWTFCIAGCSTLPFVKPLSLIKMMGEGSFPWGAVTLLAVVSTVLPYLLYTYGLTGMGSGRASVLASVEPVVATLTGVIAYREKMTVLGACGVALVILAVILLNLSVSKGHKKSTDQEKEEVCYESDQA